MNQDIPVVASAASETVDVLASSMSQMDGDDVFGSALCWTPEIDKLMAKVMDWMRMDTPGAHVCGPMRAGKTRACKYITRAMPLSGTVALHWTIPREPPDREADCLRSFMAQSGCFSTSALQSSTLRLRLVNHLHNLAASRQARRILIAVDEANRLNEVHYGWLMSIFNEIELRPLKPFFLLVGEPSLHDALARFKANANGGVLGRFFSKYHVLYNIAADDLQDTLAAFEVADKDAGLGPRAFVSRAYEEGFTLESLAPAFRTAISVLERKHAVAFPVGLPMQNLRSAVVWILLRIHRKEVQANRVSAADVVEALEESGLDELMSVYAAVVPRLRESESA
jgi:hypothetical protein